MSYLGKVFVLDSQENFEQLLDSFGDVIPAEMKKVSASHKGTVKLEKNGDEYTLTTSRPVGGDKAQTFRNGVEYDDDMAGKKCKTTNTVSGDTLTHVMKFEDGATLTIKREFSGNQQIVTINASSGASAKRIYKA